MLMASAHFFKLYETPNWGFLKSTFFFKYCRINPFVCSFRDLKHNNLPIRAGHSETVFDENAQMR